MKLLLDENLPHAFRRECEPHEAFTVAYMGWQSFSNGALLAKAAEEGFDALVTHDSGIAYQHNPDALAVAVVVLRAQRNTLEHLRPLVPRCLLRSKHWNPGQL